MSDKPIHPITRWLSERSTFEFTMYVGAMAFLTYTCMYGLRRPYTAASFDGYQLWGMNFKSWLVVAQVVGYALSKFIGIKVISEMGRSSRAVAIIVLTAIAEVALIIFALVPAPYNFFILFFNGLPLGMIWGLVFSYLEGRRTTEVLGTMLSVSFIVASGMVKSAGSLVMELFSVSEFQMPWITGMFFFVLLLGMVWLLDKTPDPTPEDQALRTKRVPMDGAMRLAIFKQFAPGLVALVAVYIMLTVFRDLRDNFAAEIYSSMGLANNSMIFLWTEIPVAFVVFVIMASMMWVKNNRRAFLINHILIGSGFLITGLATIGLKTGLTGPLTWMILLGLGTYMGYMPFNSFLFDRLIATFGSAANAGFFIYVADSFGYLGTVSTMLYQNFGDADLSWFDFLSNGAYGLALVGGALITFSFVYFYSKMQKTRLSQKE